MPLRIVLGGVGINIGIANMYRDIVSGVGDSVFVSGLAGGHDLDRLIVRRPDINGVAAYNRKEKGKKDR